MEVMKGYDKKGIGIIPQDWGIAPVSELVRKGDGIKIGPFGSQLKKELLVKRGFKVYGQENVFHKNLEIGNRYLTKNHFIKLQSCELSEGDFIVSMMGTIGKTMVMPKSFEKGIMDSHLLRLRLRGDLIDTKFLSHIFESKTLLDQVFKLSVGGIMDGLSSRIVKMILIPLPPLAEQKAIAEVLSDTDNLIQSLEKQIEKKRMIKQGVMQELLTPKENWEKIKLSKVIDVNRGGSPRPIQNYITTSSHGVNWIKIGDTSSLSKFITESKEKIISEGVQYSRKVNVGDFLLSNSMSFGRPYILRIEGCIHDGWLVLQNYQSSFDTEFLYYTLMSKDVFNQYLAKASGSGVLNLNKELVKTIELNRPKNLIEQTRIAKILSDMDSGLGALEKKLNKYKAIKKGLMQSLLTGKIRLLQRKV